MRLLNGDEALINITVFDILHGKFTIWCCGYTYIGALSNYISAPFVALFGNSDTVFRLPALVYRILGMFLCSVSLELLLGRKAAIQGVLFSGLWPIELNDQLLTAEYMGFFVFEMYCAIFFLVCAFHFRDRIISFGMLLGFVSGLGLWTTPITLTMTVPFAAAYLFSSSPSWKKIAALATFLPGSLPFWYYNLIVTRMGTFHENLVTAGFNGSVSGKLIGASHNWSFFFSDVLQSLFNPEKYFVISHFLPILFVISWGLFIVVVFRTRRERESGFWIFAILGTLLIWMLAVGFAGAGSLRGRVSRYMLPIFVLTPFVFAFLIQFQRKLLVLLIPFLIVPVLALFETGPRLQILHSSASMKRKILEIARQANADYIIGDFWDVLPYAVWTSGRMVAISTTNNLPLLFGHPPQDLPQTSRGLLLFRKNSAIQNALQSKDLLTGLKLDQLRDYGRERDATQLQVYEVATLPVESKLANLIATVKKYHENYDLFVQNKTNELDLNPALYVLHATRFDVQNGNLKLKTNHQQEFFSYGPYIRLNAGKYEVQYVFEPSESQDFTVVTDIISELGDRTIARQSYTLSGNGGILKTTFSVAPRDRAFYEMRVYVVRTNNWITLSHTVLKRL